MPDIPRPTIVIVTCMWRRPKITAHALLRYARAKAALDGILDLEMIVVGSEGKPSRRLAEGKGWRYVERANRPLGRKWNHAVQAAKTLDPDAVLIVGSDDWLSDPLLRWYAETIAQDVSFAGLLDEYFVDTKTRRALHFPGYRTRPERGRPDRRGEPMGLGRMLSRELLTRIGWRPWSDRIERGLDGNMTHRLGGYRRGGIPGARLVRIPQIPGASAVDFKSGDNMWSFRHFSARSKPVAFSRVMAPFPKDEVRSLVRTLKRLRHRPTRRRSPKRRPIRYGPRKRLGPQ